MGDLLRSPGSTYDATRPVFLPPLFAFLCCLFSACGPVVTVPQEPVPRQAASQAEHGGPRIEVVAGRGEVSAALLEDVRHQVQAGVADLQKVFPGQPHRPFFVFVHGGRADLPAELAQNLHPGSPGFALLGRHQIHLVIDELRHSGATLPGVVRHELVHELLDQRVEPHGDRLPRWFHEGLAQHLAGDTYLGGNENDLAWRVAVGRLLPFGDLRRGFPSDEHGLRLAYAQSHSYVTWLVNEFGLGDLLAAANAADDLTSFEQALCGRTDRSSIQLQLGWEHYLEHGSGASWRVLMEQSFSLMLVAALPLLVLALMRRLAVDKRAAERLAAASAREEQLAAEAEAAALLALPEPLPDALSAPDDPGEDEDRQIGVRSPEGEGDRRDSW